MLGMGCLVQICSLVSVSTTLEKYVGLSEGYLGILETRLKGEIFRGESGYSDRGGGNFLRQGIL